MKLTDIKKKADAKIAEEKVKQEEARRLRELDIHPLVKWKCDRNVREAYFQGVVFAALSNDLKIDEAEQKILSRIGNSLAIPKDEQVELTTLVQKSVDAAVKAGGADVFVPLEDCVSTLKDENVAKLFAAEYVKVCGARELDVENVREQLADHIAPKTGVSLKPAFISLLYRIVVNGKDVQDVDLVALADILGDDILRYFELDVLGDVMIRLQDTRKRRESEARRKKEQVRLEKVRAEFDVAASQVGKFYADYVSMPLDWKTGIEKRLETYEKSDIDFVTAINKRIAALWAIAEKKTQCPGGVYAPVLKHFCTLAAKSVIPSARKKERRKIVWELVCLLWVAEKTVYPKRIDELLRGAATLSNEGFNERIENFIRISFAGIPLRGWVCANRRGVSTMR